MHGSCQNKKTYPLCKVDFVYSSVPQAWLNEKFSPELLENKSEMGECVMEQLTHMVNGGGIPQITKGCSSCLSKQWGTSNNRISMLCCLHWQEANLQRVRRGDVKASVHRMEIDRIRFVLSSYLRSRLQKVTHPSMVFDDVLMRGTINQRSDWHRSLWSFVTYVDWEVFPSCPGEREISSGGRYLISVSRGVCLCQRVSVLVTLPFAIIMTVAGRKSVRCLNVLFTSIVIIVCAVFHLFHSDIWPTQRPIWRL